MQWMQNVWNLKNEYPLNKKAKRYKMKKKILVETWSDCDSSSSDDESMIEAKANFYLMEKDDKVCNNDNFDDLNTLQHEYDCLFIDFEKLMSKCKELKKTITSLNLELDNAKNEYKIVIGNRNDLEDAYKNAKSEIEALRLELENKDKTLLVFMNENFVLKFSINEKTMQCSNKYSKFENRQNRKHKNVACYKCGVKGHMPYKCYYIKHDSSLFKKIWIPKDSHILSNHKGPIKVCVLISFK